MAVVKNLMIRAGADFSALEKELRSAEKKIKSAGKNLTKAGKELTKHVTAPIVGMGAVAVKAAVDYEAAFAGVRKTVDATEEQFTELSDGIRQMSKEIPLSAVEIAGLAESAGQLGIETESVLGFVRVMADLGATTNIIGEEGAADLARFANITQMSQGDFDKLGSTIVKVGNSLATTEAEIVDMAMRLAGAGHQVGMTEAEIIGLSGALSSLGLESQAGGTAFSKVMVQMQLAAETGGKRLEDFAKISGISAGEFAHAYKTDAMSALLMFIEGLEKSKEEGDSAIKVLDDMGIRDARMRDSLLRASGASDIFTRSIELGTEAWSENTALAEKSAERYKTTAAQLDMLKNRLIDLGVSFGEIILPHVNAFVEHLKKLTEWFSSLDEKTKSNIVTALGLAAVIGPLMMVFGGVATKIAGVIGMIRKFSVAISAGKGIVMALGAALGPAGVVMVALVAFAAAAFLIIKNWDKIKEFFGSLKTFITDKFEALKSLPQAMNQLGKNIIQGLIDGIKAKFAAVKDAVKGVGSRITGGIKSLVSLPAANSGGAYKIPALASGGIVNRPTLALVGEAGPEAVVPLNKGLSMNHTGVIRVEGVDNKGQLMGVVDIVMDELRRELRR